MLHATQLTHKLTHQSLNQLKAKKEASKLEERPKMAEMRQLRVVWDQVVAELAWLVVKSH